MDMKDKLLNDLVAIASVSSDLAACKQVLQVVVDFFADMPTVKCQLHECNGKHSLVVSTLDQKEYKLIYSGHLDVVPAEAEQFIPHSEGTKLYGRGTSDMKGTVAAMCVAAKQIWQQNPQAELALLLTTDEEVGGLDGCRYLIDELGYTAPVVFLPDPGRGDWSICTDEKGGIWYELTATGKSAHASRPWQGENAIGKLLAAVVEIQQAFKDKWSEPTAENNWLPTCNLSGVNGGVNFNSVPEVATAKLDIRFPAAVGLTEIAQLVKGITTKHDINIASPINFPANHAAADHAATKAWVHLATAQAISPEFYQAHGSSDARFFANKGMHVLMTKSLASDIHIEDEWIDTEDLARFTNILVEWTQQLLA
jgi:succinyl-diaminopimelate desuccinylase